MLLWFQTFASGCSHQTSFGLGMIRVWRLWCGLVGSGLLLSKGRGRDPLGDPLHAKLNHSEKLIIFLVYYHRLRQEIPREAPVVPQLDSPGLSPGGILLEDFEGDLTLEGSLRGSLGGELWMDKCIFLAPATKPPNIHLSILPRSS